MKVTICGSIKFYEQMLQLSGELQAVELEVEMPDNMGLKIDFDTLPKAEQVSLKKGFIDGHIEKIRQSDAILVANYDKNRQTNYIGANTFMEIAFAYILGKKIYILNKIPKQANTLEIEAMRPVILNGDISRLQ